MRYLYRVVDRTGRDYIQGPERRDVFSNLGNARRLVEIATSDAWDRKWAPYRILRVPMDAWEEVKP